MEFLDFSNQDGLVRNILETLHCPFCDFDYIEEDIKIVAKLEKNYITHLSCGECGNSIMATISYGSKKEAENFNKQLFNDGKKQKLDIPFNKILDFLRKGPVGNEDIMNFCKGIKSFDGDFQKIFFEPENKNKMLRAEQRGFKNDKL